LIFSETYIELKVRKMLLQ